MSRDVGIADRLRAAGLNVVEVPGWRTRGSDQFAPRGFVLHHTAGTRSGNSPSLNICVNGRAGLPGPLCNIYMARDCTIHVVAAGRANHAGAGSWHGLSGNASVYGLEVENVGTPTEPWREDQLDTIARAVATFPVATDLVCQHKEWAPNRKVDMHTVSGAEMRRRVAEVRAPKPEPAPTPPSKPSPVEDVMPLARLMRTKDDPQVWLVDGYLQTRRRVTSEAGLNDLRTLHRESPLLVTEDVRIVGPAVLAEIDDVSP